VRTLIQLTGVALPAAAPACVCRLHMVAVQQAALVSDESALEACTCSRLCAIQIDNLYLYLYLTLDPPVGSSYSTTLTIAIITQLFS